MKAKKVLRRYVLDCLDDAERSLGHGAKLSMGEIKQQIEDVIENDSKRIKDVKEGLTTESRWVTDSRNFLRPLITILLTVLFLAFGIFGYAQFSSEPNFNIDFAPGGKLEQGEKDEIIAEVGRQIREYEKERFAQAKDFLTMFLAVYGPILGFWFGEHTANKGRKEEAEAREALEQRLMATQSGNPSGGSTESGTGG